MVRDAVPGEPVSDAPKRTFRGVAGSTESLRPQMAFDRPMETITDQDFDNRLIIASRMANFWTLPVTVIGYSETK